MKSRRFDVNL